MSDVLNVKTQTARKHYNCDACRLWVNSGYGMHDVSADDYLVVCGAEADRWKIKPGDKYVKVTRRDGRNLVTYRARLDMDSVCKRNNIFDEC
jgi:hypothetical protein